MAGTEASTILRLSPDTADLARLYPWLEAVAEEAGLPAGIRSAMHVAIEEAVVNVAMHAVPTGAAREIVVSFKASPAVAVMVVENTGLAFDPTLVTPLPTPKSIEDAQPGGLGLTLMRHYCRDVGYERIGARNRLTLSFPREPDQAAPAREPSSK